MSRSLFRDLVLGGVVFVVLAKFVPLPRDASLALQLVHHVAVLVTSLSIPVVWLMYRNRDLVRMLLEVVSDENTRRVAPVRDLVRMGLTDLHQRISELYHSPGLRLSNTDELREFARACFRHARSTYRGIDTHVPSEWMKRYRVFLEEQRGAIRRSASASERILAVSQTALRDDLREHGEVFLEFYQWHRNNGIMLLQIDPSEAGRFSREAEVHAVDVAFWVDQYAVIFRPCGDATNQDAVIVQMLLSDEARYRDARRYIAFVTDKAVSIEYDDARRDLVFRDRQQSESEFVYEGVDGAS